MNAITKKNLILSLKKTVIKVSIIFILTFLQLYFSMEEFSTKISSGCLDCSFYEDILVGSIVSSFLLGLLFYFFAKIKQKIIEILLQYLFVIAIWFFWNYTIFVDRESSWSTYLFEEEIYSTIEYSFIPIVILSSILIFILNYIKKVKQN